MGIVGPLEAFERRFGVSPSRYRECVGLRSRTAAS